MRKHDTAPYRHLVVLSTTNETSRLEDLGHRADAWDLKLSVRFEPPTVRGLYADALPAGKSVAIYREKGEQNDPAPFDQKGVTHSELEWSAHTPGTAERRASLAP